MVDVVFESVEIEMVDLIVDVEVGKIIDLKVAVVVIEGKLVILLVLVELLRVVIVEVAVFVITLDVELFKDLIVIRLLVKVEDIFKFILFAVVIFLYSGKIISLFVNVINIFVRFVNLVDFVLLVKLLVLLMLVIFGENKVELSFKLIILFVVDEIIFVQLIFFKSINVLLFVHKF